ncbi:N-acetylglucosamine-6-phosphate deacetylase [Galbitalea sp. SE-J8]|uniref:N-acetylglucosamine-6-phosphate deacetylase n=1 Tax=Galbitalea sp. SE-J8 TaxID=3054952 RepID=UPI00259CFC9E|nr:N-acetylglucosamine-6-phosphate deacetylase [Galbitalea sp. SE-J8]MDM4761395.1 N-acetylglucosamine-6-phosphate deacetylase [Galbitalea sp. SE-J8]
MSALFAGGRKIDAAGIVDDFWMLVDDGVIAATGTGLPPRADETVDLDGDWLAPGFIDLHCHGGAEHAFEYDTLLRDAAAISAGLAPHRAGGTTRSVISLVTAPLVQLEACLDTVASIAADDPLVLGAHLEGPFLAHDRRGAHDPAFLREPNAEIADRLIDAARGALTQVTLAPELPGALHLVERFVESGATVAVGHTAADYATTRAAFDRGARLLTHAFNAMPDIQHRAPGPVVAAFDDERVALELILDGHHVDPGVARLAFAASGGRVALVTDAMAAAGAADGDYRLGLLNVTVRDGVAMLRGTTTIAGSTLTLDVALRVAITLAGIDPVAAIAALTAVPARALGRDDLGLLAAGRVADAVRLDGSWHVRGVWADGRRISG